MLYKLFFFFKQQKKNPEILTVVKDSVIDLGSLPQSHSLLHQSRNSIFIPVCRGNDTISITNYTWQKRVYISNLNLSI